MPKIFQLYRGQLRVKDMNLCYTEDAIHQLILNIVQVQVKHQFIPSDPSFS